MSHDEYQVDHEKLDQSVKARYELRDANFGSVGRWINGFFWFTMVVGIVGAYLLMMFIFNVLVKTDHKFATIPVTAPKNLPKAAPLQNNVTATKDMTDLRMAEQEMTHTYGDSKTVKGSIQIPVDRAMEIVAKKGINGGQTTP